MAGVAIIPAILVLIGCFNHILSISGGRDFNRKLHRLVPVQIVGDGLLLFFPDAGCLCQAGIIEWNMDRTGDLLMGRIEEHG